MGVLVGVAVVMAFVRFGGVDLRGLIHKKPAPQKVVPPEVKVPQPELPSLAIVIDDMGPNLTKLKELINVGGPVTVSVMPYQRFSRETATVAYENGLDVMLHLPMEPLDLKDHNPGPGALFIRMTSPEVKAQVEDDITNVPHVIGINNHMGSRFTEDEPLMRAVLDVVKEKNLFFIDSRTTGKSVAGRVARDMGVPSAGRNVFLDNTRDIAYIKGQLMQAVRIARKNGRAIAIGHPYPETIEALKESMPGLDAMGVRAVKISDIMKEKDR